MKFLELKKYIKELAKEIKEMKGLRKDTELRRASVHDKYTGGYVHGLIGKRYHVRHHHIAYCLLRGRKYSEIENPREFNKPNMRYVSEIVEKIEPREITHA